MTDLNCQNNTSNISDTTRNALEELGNIGAGNAATSLSVMLSSELKITPPEVELCEFNDLEEKIGGADATVVGVLSDISGDMNAKMLFILGIEDTKKLVKALIGDSADWFSDMGMSAVKEIANIIIGSYVASLESLSGIKVRHALPQICIDMAGAILSVPCIEFGMVSDQALLINSHFMNGKNELDGYIMLLSEMHSFNLLLNRLGIGGIDE